MGTNNKYVTMSCSAFDVSKHVRTAAVGTRKTNSVLVTSNNEALQHNDSSK